METNVLCTNFNQQNYCSVCLSINRQLFSIKKYENIFRKIGGKIKLSPLLCWECVAVLKKIKEFKDKVDYSTKVLKKIVKDHNQSLNSLSNLKIVNNESLTIINYSRDNKDDLINTDKKDDIRFKVELDSASSPNGGTLPECKSEIKQEILDENEFNDDVHDENNFGTDNVDNCDEIKQEVESEINKVTETNNCKRLTTKHYRVISDEVKIKDIDKFVLRVQLDVNEVKTYMDNERNSELYAKFLYKCDSCVCGWKYKRRLIEHNKKFHCKSAGKHQCGICLRYFSSKRLVALHIKSHFTVFECRVCSYRSYMDIMRRHLIMHYQKFECIECGARFSNIFTFHSHHKELHYLFICDLCGKKTKSKKVLEKHMSRHYEKYECKICGRKYKSRFSYRRHNEEKHSTAHDDAYCVQCDKKFCSKVLLKRHILHSNAHAAERDNDTLSKKWPCPDCGRVYSRRCYMMNHYRHFHLKQSNYYCGQCDKHFLNRTRYIDHVKYNHEGLKKEKNKLCNICGRGFAANRTLIHHIRTHSGERPFECQYCDAKFTQKQAMLSHVNHIHLKNKRHKSWQQ